MRGVTFLSTLLLAAAVALAGAVPCAVAGDACKIAPDGRHEPTPTGTDGCHQADGAGETSRVDARSGETGDPTADAGRPWSPRSTPAESCGGAMLCASAPAGAAPAAAPLELPPVAGDVDVRDRDLGPAPHGSPLDHVPRR